MTGQFLARTLPGLRSLLTAAVPLMLILGYALAFDGASRRIGSPDPVRDYFLAILWALVLFGLFAVIANLREEKRALLFLWLVKIGVTLGFMLFYESHYGLDATNYFQVGMRDPGAWREMEIGLGTKNMFGLASLHDAFIPRSYHAMKISFSALGLAAVYIFYRATALLLGRRDVRLLYLIGLFPSVLFWGSILGKDPVVLLGISGYVLGIISYYRGRGVGGLTIAAIGLLLATSMRLWLALIFLLPLGFLLVIGKPGWFRRLLFAVVAIPAFIFALQAFSERFRLETADDLVESTDKVASGWARGGSAQQARDFGSIGQMIAFIPFGSFTALFRPLPGEILNPFGLLAGVENAALLFLAINSFRYGRWKRVKAPLAAWLLVTVLTWSAIYGFASYQNLGSAFRFRVQVAPIMLMIVVFLYADHSARASSLKRNGGRLVRVRRSASRDIENDSLVVASDA